MTIWFLLLSPTDSIVGCKTILKGEWELSSCSPPTVINNDPLFLSQSPDWCTSCNPSNNACESPNPDCIDTSGWLNLGYCCGSIVEPSSGCSETCEYYRGDGVCDMGLGCNVAECGFDGGDCGSQRCPNEEPRGGESCSGSISCPYGEVCCCGSCHEAKVYECSSGKWSVTYPDRCEIEGCNPEDC